jgi:hypothetical protein
MGPTISRRFVSTLKAAPLFTTDTVSGTITLSDSVAPGAQFSAADVTALSFTFFGITGTLADVQADQAPLPVQLFGTRSADGNSFSVFDLGFGFGAPFSGTVAGCASFCDGNLHINSPFGADNTSNFSALDIADDSLSVASFTPQFTLLTAAVPKSSTWAMMILGFAGIGAMTYRVSRSGACQPGCGPSFTGLTNQERPRVAPQTGGRACQAR